MKLWRAAALAPALLLVGVLAPTHPPVQNAPVSHTSKLPPCPKQQHAHPHKTHTAGGSQNISVTVPALPGLNCR